MTKIIKSNKRINTITIYVASLILYNLTMIATIIVPTYQHNLHQLRAYQLAQQHSDHLHTLLIQPDYTQRIINLQTHLQAMTVWQIAMLVGIGSVILFGIVHYGLQLWQHQKATKWWVRYWQVLGASVISAAIFSIMILPPLLESI